MRILLVLSFSFVLVGCGGRDAGTVVPAVVDERCEFDGMVGGRTEPGAQDIVGLPKKAAWEAAFGGQEPARPHIRARLSGWPERLAARRQPPNETDHEFMTRLARDTWRGLSAFVDREHRLPIDNVRLDADPRVGDYTNITTVGLRMIAIVAARETEAHRGRGSYRRVAHAFCHARSSRAACRLLLQLLRHDVARTQQQLRLLRGLVMADGRPHGGARDISRAGADYHAAHRRPGLPVLLRPSTSAHVTWLLRPPGGHARYSTTGSFTRSHAWAA